MVITSQPSPQANPSLQADFEKEMVDGFVQSVRRAGLRTDQIEVVNFYVALKSKPLAILVGPAETGKVALVRCLAHSLMGNEPLHCQMMSGHPWWADKNENIALFTGIQTSFITEKLLCLIEEAWQPENAGRLFLACLARISPAEILDFFSAVAFQLRHGQLMRLGNVHLSEPIPWPPNLLLIGTMDVVRYDWWDPYLIAQTNVVMQSQARAEKSSPLLPEAPVLSWEREFMRSIVRTDQAVFRKLHNVLGWRRSRWLRQPFQPLLEIEALMETLGVQLPPAAIREALVYLANAWTRRGSSLFDPSPLKNLSIALDLAIAQTILPHVVERIGSSRVTFDGLQNALDVKFPRSAAFLEKLRWSPG
ncbi:MAG TPA: hypothetical protein VJL34_12560 [Anaerolineales bacterium]|nr:hypothetical protein [Anaerolineales bacterium]